MSKQAGIVLTGDWRRLNSILRGLNTTADDINDIIKSEAEGLRDILIDEIADFDAVPNADSTSSRKGFNDPLVESGYYASKLGVIVDEFSESYKKKYYIVKGNPNETHKRTGLTYEDVAELMEFGSSGAGRDGNAYIPPRPVFTMTFETLKDSIENSLIMKTREYFRGRVR